MFSRNNKIISCLCGGIKLKVNGPLRHVSNCHCFQCMKTHGNYAAYTAAKEKDVIFLKKGTLNGLGLLKKLKEDFAKNAVLVFFLNSLEMIQFLFQLECSIIQQN